VVTDRFDGSTLAYQGAGRGLGLAELRSVLEFATSGVEADLSVLLDVALETARGRVGTTEPDRLERLDAAFHERVADGYRSLAAADPKRWVVVDGTGSVEEVAQAVAAAVSERLGEPWSGQ
jgi:dTMP kinase